MLLKSRFIEMFGNPIVNEKKWKVVLLDDACEGIGDGLHGTPKYDDLGDYPFINGNNLIDGVIKITTSTRMVNEETYKKHYTNINNNAILISINGTLGKLAFYNGEKLMLGKSACYCNLKSNINRDFVYSVMKTEAFAGYLDSNSTSSTIKNIGLKAMRAFRLIQPPSKMQIEYVDFAKQIDKSKFLLQQMIAKLELLKKSRFVEMFGDPVLNPYKLKKDSFRHICEELFAGGDKPSDIVLTKDETHPYPVYANGYENLGFMGFSSQCRVNKPAITISARGTIGFSCIRQAGFTPIVRLLTLIPKTGIDLDYLKFAIDFYSFTSSGTSQKQLTVPDIAKYEVLVPDYSSQQCFATFVHQLDKLKAILQKQLDDLVGSNK